MKSIPPPRKITDGPLIIVALATATVITMLSVHGQTRNFFEYASSNLDNVKFYEYFIGISRRLAIAVGVIALLEELYRQKGTVGIGQALPRAVIYGVILAAVSMIISSVVAIILYPPF